MGGGRVCQDELYLDQLKKQCHDVVRRILGPLKSLQWARETELAAELLYYALTTGKGLQTLGEEYCEILQTAGVGAGVPPGKIRSGVLVLLQAVVPYVHEKILMRYADRSVGDSLSDWGAMYRASHSMNTEINSTNSQDSTRVKRMANVLLGCIRHGWLRVRENMSAMSNDVMAGLENRVPSSLKQEAHRLRRFLIQNHGTLMRFHLALFYVFGLYYQFSKRFAAVRYVSTSSVSPQSHASFRALGYILLLQLAVAGGVYAFHRRGYISFVPTSIVRYLGYEANEQRKSGRTKRNYVALLRVDGSEIKPEDEKLAYQEAASSSETEKTNGNGTQSDAEDTWQSKKCPLCLGQRCMPTATSCGHLFCWSCIAEWVCSQRAECPLCRASIHPSDLVVVRHGGY